MSFAVQSSTPEISVVIPVCNEVDNVGPLAREIVAALNGKNFEIIFVDDGSTDGTAAAVLALRDSIPQLRLLRHSIFTNYLLFLTYTKLIFKSFCLQIELRTLLL